MLVTPRPRPGQSRRYRSVCRCAQSSRHWSRGGSGRGGRLSRGLFSGEPGVVRRSLHDLDDDRHEPVVATAEFSALAAIRADLVGLEPQLVDVTGDGVLLHAEIGHPPRVQHIGGGDQHAHFRADRHHERIVDLEQIILDGRGRDARVELPRRITGAGEGRKKAHAVIDIVVLPLPLVAGDLDREFGAGRVFDLHERPGRRDRHGDQDHDRDQRPDDLGIACCDRNWQAPRLSICETSRSNKSSRRTPRRRSPRRPTGSACAARRFRGSVR